MNKILLDTDFVLWHLHDDKPQQILLRLLNEKGMPCISALSFFEVTTQENMRDGKSKKAMDFLKMFSVCDVNSDIASLAGKLLSEYREISAQCAFIAATCLHHGLMLVTRCPERYPVPELKCLVFNENTPSPSPSACGSLRRERIHERGKNALHINQ